MSLRGKSSWFGAIGDGRKGKVASAVTNVSLGKGLPSLLDQLRAQSTESCCTETGTTPSVNDISNHADGDQNRPVSKNFDISVSITAESTSVPESVSVNAPVTKMVLTISNLDDNALRGRIGSYLLEQTNGILKEKEGSESQWTLVFSNSAVHCNRVGDTEYKITALAGSVLTKEQMGTYSMVTGAQPDAFVMALMGLKDLDEQVALPASDMTNGTKTDNYKVSKGPAEGDIGGSYCYKMIRLDPAGKPHEDPEAEANLTNLMNRVYSMTNPKP